MNEKRHKELEFFGFKLNQTSAAILFLLVLTTLLSSIITLYIYFIDLYNIFPRPAFSDLIFFSIRTVLELIPLLIIIYSLIICLKLRDNNSSNENNLIKSFGFELNGTSAIVLFFRSMIGVTTFCIGIIGMTSIFIFYWDMLWDITGFYAILMPYILLSIVSILLLLIYVWIMRRSLVKLKKNEEERQITRSDRLKNTNIFGFELNETSGSIIFIQALVGILSNIFILIFMIESLLIMTGPTSISLNLLYLIVLLLLLGIYIYSLICCLRLRDSNFNNNKEGIKWFGLNINHTSAVFLYVMSILGFFSFLSAIFSLIRSAIIGLWLGNNLIELIEYLFYPIVNLIKGIILLVIYIYTFRKCVEVRKMMQ